MSKRWFVLLAIVVVAIAASSSFSSAQAQPFKYAAKYVCGKATGSPDNFAPGIYFTSINVHSDRDIDFRKRFTVSRIDERPGGTTDWIGTGLPAGNSFQIECRNILAHLTAAGIPIPLGQVTEGYVILLTDIPLDVFGVYTAAGPDWVSTLHMERIDPQKAP